MSDWPASFPDFHRAARLVSRAARAADGTVEGLEHASLPIVSVQWHPEMMTSRDVDPIFGWLIEAAVASQL